MSMSWTGFIMSPVFVMIIWPRDGEMQEKANHWKYSSFYFQKSVKALNTTNAV